MIWALHQGYVEIIFWFLTNQCSNKSNKSIYFIGYLAGKWRFRKNPAGKLLFQVPINDCVQSYNKNARTTPNNPTSIYLFNVNNRSTRTMCKICSELTINTPEGHQWGRTGAFNVNFEKVSHVVLVFLLSTLNK